MLKIELSKQARKDTYLYPIAKMLKDIVKTERCMLCGGCVAACPVSAIGIKDYKPTLISNCYVCGICYTHCPRTGLNFDEVEQHVFGRVRSSEDKIGVYSSIAVARAKDPKLNKLGQDGGVITALLKYALDKGYLKGAITTKRINSTSWEPTPFFANSNNIHETAGAIYSVSASNQLLGKIYHEYSDFVGCNICMNSIGLVGTPCQIESFRKMQFSDHGRLKIADIVSLTISTFCWGNYHYDKLKEFLESKGYDLSKITKIVIKKGVLTGYENTTAVFSFKISELKTIKMAACSECMDLTGELADISVGGQGVAEGWSFIILRTEFGEKIFNEAVEAGYLEKGSPKTASEALKEIIDSSNKKKEQNKVNIESSPDPLVKISHRI
ncbi:MAG: Coenzyme F420 hydrogenase/dehydrogenase, beta subunit C-terminal domain [Candidatus Odinarchaeota archaeon]